MLTVSKPSVENLTRYHCQNLFLGFDTKLRQVLFLQVTVLCLLIIESESLFGQEVFAIQLSARIFSLVAVCGFFSLLSLPFFVITS